MTRVKIARNKILIIFIARIGDLILFTPVLKGLLRHYGNCEISIIVPPDLAHCVKKMPYFNEIVVCRTSNKYNLLTRILQLVRLCVSVVTKKFDIVITPLAVTCTTALVLSRVSRAKIKIGYTRNEDKNHIFTESIKLMPFEHDVVQNLKVLSKLNINSFDEKMEFYISENDRSAAQIFLKNNGMSENDTLVALHPVSQKEIKNWPAERFAQLGYKVSRQYGTKIIIFGSSEEKKVAEDIKAVIGEKAIIQAGKTSIQVAAAILERCKLLVCNDSSIMHIGAAIGIPMVAIWGPSNHIRRGYSNNNQTIIRENLPCSPCPDGIYAHKCDTRECLLQIPVDKVFDGCKKILFRKMEK